MFCDLALTLPPAAGAVAHQRQLATAYALGYRIVGLVQETNGRSVAKKVVKRAVLPTINDNVPRLLSRLTITLDEADQNYSINASSDVLTPFDVVAVRPLTEKAFQTACATLEMDVITLDMSTRLPFYLKHTTLHLAMSRGIFFEITYASALHDASARRQLIANASRLISITKGRNIIVSSGAASALELRGPYDVMNMCTLFGLSPSVAKDCLSTNMRQVLYHAAARRGVHKGAVSLATDFAAMTPSALLSSMSDEDDPMET